MKLAKGFRQPIQAGRFQRGRAAFPQKVRQVPRPHFGYRNAPFLKERRVGPQIRPVGQNRISGQFSLHPQMIQKFNQKRVGRDRRWDLFSAFARLRELFFFNRLFFFSGYVGFHARKRRADFLFNLVGEGGILFQNIA
jgi:hypothetical protein